MTYGDINSGAVPQPGGVVFARDAEATTAPEQVAKATEDALAGEGAFANVEAGIKTNDEVAVTQPVVEKDDEEASGKAPEAEDQNLGYIPVTEADDQAASGEGTGNERVPGSGTPDEDEEDADGEDGPPAKSALKEEWVKYAVSKGMSEDEANDATVAELQDKYGN